MAGAVQRIVVQATAQDKKAIAAKAKKLDLPVSELMRRGAFAYQSGESDAELAALADTAKSAADRAGAAIDDDDRPGRAGGRDQREHTDDDGKGTAQHGDLDGPVYRWWRSAGARTPAYSRETPDTPSEGVQAARTGTRRPRASPGSAQRAPASSWPRRLMMMGARDADSP